MGFLTLLTEATAPVSKFSPSMTIASISTLPLSVKTEPRPVNTRLDPGVLGSERLTKNYITTQAIVRLESNQAK